MAMDTITLDDKYAQERGRVYVTGTQALVRLPLMQRRRDAAAGLKTAGFISGYRGSPLGAYDRALWQAQDFLAANDIRFQPGVNEDLAATAIWGTQQVGLYTKTDYDGVFGIWYGKQPGVDRSGDPFKHANYAGTSPNGGVLALLGDDPGAKSSTITGQSELALAAHGIPVLNPADVQDFIDFGLYGFALSRYSGLWVGIRCVSESVEASASVSVDPERVTIVRPEDFVMPEGGLNIRMGERVPPQEQRLVEYRLPAARAFARANGLDRVARDAPRRRLGLVTTGKAYSDTLEALAALGIGEAERADLGITVYKVGMVWPLETEGARAYAEGQEELIVVEEKRPVIEDQLARALYDMDRRPRLVGKADEDGKPLIKAHGEIDAESIMPALAQRILKLDPPSAIAARLDAHLQSNRGPAASNPVVRTPWFCSGCPHNTSTRVPEGSMALAGIGCHTLAMLMNRKTMALTHMGGEGGSWIGMAPFVEEQHMFQNIGDGTYFHSGSMGIRAAVAAGVNITFKVLYNDAIAMTGGQPVDGALDPSAISRQAAAEGVKTIAVVTDEPDKYPIGTHWAPGTRIHHRDELDRVQRDLRETPGVSVLIYDQTCAAEKRRRRKRNAFPDPPKRVVINELVCEGCGDCGDVSNCVSVLPLETPFGRKRTIDQSNCNKDYSCVNGFCPSFVTVHGGELRRAAVKAPVKKDVPDIALPAPETAPLDGNFNILVTGIGGTGVVTIGALVGMAAHIDGRGVSVLDITGIAQKNGSVMSHIRIASEPGDIGSTRIPARHADVILGCDMVVATSAPALAVMDRERTRAVVNDHIVPVGAFTENPDLDMDRPGMLDLLSGAVGKDRMDMIDATALATAVLGNSIGANLFLLGFAFQRGLVPVSKAALIKAVELNGVSVAMNKQAFALGRRAAIDPEAVTALARPARDPSVEGADEAVDDDLGAMVDRRVDFLTDYQNAAYAQRYKDLVSRVLSAEVPMELSGLAEAVARYYFKLLAHKDEYEVARLLTAPEFRHRIASQFQGKYSLRYHLAPPLFSKRDPNTGLPVKSEYRGWIYPAMRLLAAMRWVRETPLDIFGYTAERRRGRALVGEYEALIGELLGKLTPENHALAIEIASFPEHVRGYGHIRERHLMDARQKLNWLLARFRGEEPEAQAAE